MKKKLFLTLLFGAVLFESIGQIISPFSIRAQFSQKGGIRFLANTSVSCGTASGCTTAQNQIPPSGTAQNNNFTMQYVDIDNDASTFMSTSDSLDLPSCSEITWAGLYWSAYSNTSMANYANRFSVKLKVNDGAYQTLTANATDRLDNSTGYTSYHAFYNVTSIVQNAGNNARFTIADLVTNVGSTNRWGGWTIVVVYKNDLQPMRNLTVFNGLANVSSGSNSTVNVPISGFLTPLSGPVTFDLGVVAYDGDRSQTGDQLLFNGAGSYINVSDAIHNYNDVFNSTISYNGTLTPNRLPSYNNTLGHDANIFTPDNSSKNYIGNNATSATIRVTTGGETILTHVITSAIDIYEPDLRAAVQVVDLNGGLVEPGDTLEYTVLCKNIGSDPAINTFVTDTIEGNALFIPGSINIIYGPNSGVKTDASNDDQAEYDATSKTVKVRIGTGAGSSFGGEILNSPAGNDSTVFTFRVTASTDCVYLQCDNVIDNRAFIFGTGNVSGNTFNNGSNPGIFDGNGCPVPGTTSSPINATACPVPTASSNTPVCIGDSLLLTADSSSSATYSWTGPDGFTASVSSPALLINSSSQAGTYTCTITIPGISCAFNPTTNVVVSSCTPPVANTDFGGTITEDTSSVTINIIANDTDIDGNPSAPTNNAGQFTVDMDTTMGGIQVTDTTSEGIWVYDPLTGNLTFEPAENFSGTASIVYELCDPEGNCDTTSVIFIVTPVNDAPVVNNETATTNEDTPVTVDVLGNDSDPDNDSLVITTVVDNGNGTVTISGDSIIYTPNANFNGTDTVIVSVCDTVTPALCSNDTIIVTVTPVNDVPVIDNEYITTDEDTPVNGDVTDSGDYDVDGNLVVNTTPTSGPNHGTIVINADGTYTYTPSSNYNGNDTVIVAICDDGTPLPANCVNDTIFITVTPVNDAPVVDNETATTNEDTPVTVDVLGNDSDPDNDDLVITSVVDNGNGTVTISGDSIIYTPNANFNGTDTIIVSVCDTVTPALCSNDTIIVTVNPVNDVPVIDNEYITTDEDTPVNGDVTGSGDYDVDGNLVVNTTPTSGPNHGTIVINADGTYTYTPSSNYNGNDTVIVEICDDGTPLPANCVNDTIFITVTPVNDAPVVDNEYDTTNVDIPVSGDLTDAGDYDVDGNLVVNTTPTSGPNHGTIVINSDGTYTYTPDGSTVGTDTIVVQICDDGTPLPAICTNDTLFIVVNPCSLLIANSDCDGDGVTNGQETTDGTDPNDPCDLFVASQDTTASAAWLSDDCDNDGLTNGEETTGVDDPSTPANPGGNISDPLNPDTDGDGVTDTQEANDGTDPADPCEYVVANITLTQTGDWLTADCDGDGVTNGQEVVDGTSTTDPCDLVVANQDTTVTTAWLNADCDNDGLTNGEETTGVDNPSTPSNPNGTITNPLNPDTDGDGVTDSQEATDGTDPNDPCDNLIASITLPQSGDWLTADCDDDGLTNGEETTGVDDPSTPGNPNGNITDPLNPDTDGDGVSDTQETADGTDPTDPCDLIVANQDTTITTAWLNADCDNDGLTNGEETTGVDDPSTPSDPNGNSTDPLNPDTDGDGVTDGQEAMDGTDPVDPCDLLIASQNTTPDSSWLNADCDNDGLTNGEETTGVDDPSTPSDPNGNTTDPLNPDTDGDGVADSQETTDGTDPNDPCDHLTASITLPQTGDWLTADCDGDGVTNGQEVIDGTSPVDPCDLLVTSQDTTATAAWLAADCDNDGLTNGEEATGVDDPSTPANPNGNTTNPLNPDTDGDGVTDGQEALDGTNPNDPCDYELNSVSVTPSNDWMSEDCDGDGLTNGEETTGVDDPSTPGNPNGHTTDPLNPDTDGDGVTDGQEASDGTNPTDPCDFDITNAGVAPSIEWLNSDCDGDGLTNGEETTGVDDPSTPGNPNGNTTNPLNPDTDGDGVTDGQEATDGTNPNDPCDHLTASITLPQTGEWLTADCDGDGISNGDEVNNGSDPSNPCSPNKCGVEVPQAFTPDGDGINDVLVIQGALDYPNNEITIYNRWGNVVYHTTNYQNNWDGTSTSGMNTGGDELPTGTYFYIFDTKDDLIGVVKGYIYLQR